MLFFFCKNKCKKINASKKYKKYYNYSIILPYHSVIGVVLWLVDSTWTEKSRVRILLALDVLSNESTIAID